MPGNKEAARGYITKNRAGDDAKAEVGPLFNLIELVSVSPSAALSQRQEIMSALEEKIISKS
jgi:hypothetical protein